MTEIKDPTEQLHLPTWKIADTIRNCGYEHEELYYGSYIKTYYLDYNTFHFTIPDHYSCSEYDLYFRHGLFKKSKVISKSEWCKDIDPWTKELILKSINEMLAHYDKKRDIKSKQSWTRQKQQKQKRVEQRQKALEKLKTHLQEKS